MDVGSIHTADIVPLQDRYSAGIRVVVNAEIGAMLIFRQNRPLKLVVAEV